MPRFNLLLTLLRAPWCHLAGRTPACVQAKTVISDLVLGRPAAKANRKLAAISGRLKRDL